MEIILDQRIEEVVFHNILSIRNFQMIKHVVQEENDCGYDYDYDSDSDYDGHGQNVDKILQVDGNGSDQ
eukprot:scaffold474_cov169-Ochromonas_danica.AAC.38